MLSKRDHGHPHQEHVLIICITKGDRLLLKDAALHLRMLAPPHSHSYSQALPNFAEKACLNEVDGTWIGDLPHCCQRSTARFVYGILCASN